MPKAINHFKKICTHKKYVFLACYKAGIPIQGIFHDMSKFSPTEFFESAKYYCGDRSPIDKCKEINGYSRAWFHHRGRNKHHWEYWVDNFDKGMEPVEMPYKYTVEMLCDFIGAGKAYYGKDFTYAKELEWWKEKRKSVVMHQITKAFINKALCDLAYYERIKVNKDILNKKHLRYLYDYCQEMYK